MDRNKSVNLMADVALSSLQMGFAFSLRTQIGTGTCFLYGKEEGCFFVTTKHLIAGVKVGDDIFMSHTTGWIPQKVLAIFVHPSGYDVAAIVTDKEVSGKADYDSTFTVMPGQPLKFLGFPHGLNSNYPSESNYSTPLVRTAHFRGIIDLEGLQITILDGFNNPGYSGGPVYCCGDDGLPKLFGIISGYRYETEAHSSVYKKNDQGDYEPTQDYIVRSNSGMIYVVGMNACIPLFATIDTFQPSPAN